jgi:hypothetical protein
VTDVEVSAVTIRLKVRTKPSRQGLCINDIGPEECDLGPVLNGAYNSGCSSDCKWCGYCGDGVVDHGAGEECDKFVFPVFGCFT